MKPPGGGGGHWLWACKRKPKAAEKHSKEGDAFGIRGCTKVGRWIQESKGHRCEAGSIAATHQRRSRRGVQGKQPEFWR